MQDDEEIELKETLKYSIKFEEYEQGFKSFQQKYVYPKNIVFSIIFFIVILLYAQQIFIDVKNGMSWILMGVCIAFVAILWYNPYKIRRNLMKSISEITEDEYKMEIYSDRVIIYTITERPLEIEHEVDANDINAELIVNENGELIEKSDDFNNEIEPKTINFEYDLPEILEKKDMFIIYLKKQMFYIIPKRNLFPEQCNNIRDIFRKNLEKRFKEL